MVVEKTCRDVLGDMHTERAAVSDRQLETDLYLGIVFIDAFSFELANSLCYFKSKQVFFLVYELYHRLYFAVI